MRWLGLGAASCVTYALLGIFDVRSQTIYGAVGIVLLLGFAFVAHDRDSDRASSRHGPDPE
jgi:hypothetical protein